MREGKRPILLAVPCQVPFTSGQGWTAYQSVVVYAWRPLLHVRNTLRTHYPTRALARQLVNKGNIWSLRTTLEECELVEPLEGPVVHQSLDELLTYYREKVLEEDSSLLILRKRRWQEYVQPEISLDESTEDDPETLEPPTQKRKRKRLVLFSTSKNPSNENIQIQDRNT